MKTRLFIMISILIPVITGCEKNNNKSDESIVNTRWKLTGIYDNNSAITTPFPSGIDDFEILFQEDGAIELPGYCNYSYASYSLGDDNMITIYDIGPGTEMYCLPALAMEWETLFIDNLRLATGYSTDDNTLTINCIENSLILDLLPE